MSNINAPAPQNDEATLDQVMAQIDAHTHGLAPSVEARRTTPDGTSLTRTMAGEFSGCAAKSVSTAPARVLPLPPWEDDPAAPQPLPNRATHVPGRPRTPDLAASSSPDRPRPPVLAPFKIDADQFREEVAISAADPHGCWLAQPELEAYYGQWVSHADAECERVRAQHAVLEAHLFDHHRKVLAAQGGRVLERAVECAVKMETSWQAAMQAVLDAQAIAQGNQRLMQVLQNRHAILMQLCAEARMPSRSMPVES